MSARFFEEKEHARIYQKFRVKPSQEILDLIFGYVEEKLPKPYGLAVDVGCGSGQGTRFLSPYFEKVLGLDVSVAQIEEAKKGPEAPNVTFSVGLAEAVPVDDASVDLLTGFAAVHWFDVDKFLKEMDRILKPGGCLAFYTYTTNIKVHHKDCREDFPDVMEMMAPYLNEKFRHIETNYEEIFETIPYTDKRRCLQIMGASSRESEIELWLENILVLATKPQQSEDL